MPRCARPVSITGYYHVFDRGNSKQIIFEDDSDRYRFLSDISDRFARHEVAVLAWCLMDNHFHLMVDDPFDNLSKAMQCALTAYAKYFNGKTGRTGHLFDNRYSRVAVESDTQAVQLLDYIHLNPVKGALDSLDAYRWSSYKAYQLGYDPFDICDAAPMLDIVGGSRCYCEHLEEVAGRIWSMEVLPRRRIPDEEALSVAREVLPSIDPALLKALPRPERDACLLRLRRAHLTVKQIARITGIGATSVTKELQAGRMLRETGAGASQCVACVLHVCPQCVKTLM